MHGEAQALGYVSVTRGASNTSYTSNCFEFMRAYDRGVEKQIIIEHKV